MSAINAKTPPLMLIGDGNDPGNWEVKSVAAKFKNADAVIGEDSVDMVALGYMSAHGAAYWLPRFIDYVQTKAPQDSFHFESLLFKLSNNLWSADVRAEMTDEAVGAVSSFLDWLGGTIIMKDAPALRAAEYAHAKCLWAT